MLRQLRDHARHRSRRLRPETIMLKLMLAALCGTLLCLPAVAATLDGFARHYGERCATSDSERQLPAKFRSRNFSLVMERTTLADIQKQFKGEIQENAREQWLCYHSQAENLTWWFISRTEIEHGNLSTILLAPLDHKAKCDIPSRPVYLSGVNVPSLGASRAEVAGHFKVAASGKANCQRFATVLASKDENTTNELSYYYDDDRVAGMAIQQLTTN